MISHRDTTLRVCALGFDTRSYMALQLFFRGKCGDQAVLVGDDEAEAGIIDMDSFNAAKFLDDQRHRFPNRPLILLSLEEQREKTPNSIHVKKPVQISSMLAALEELRSRPTSKPRSEMPGLLTRKPEYPPAQSFPKVPGTATRKAEPPPQKPSPKAFVAWDGAKAMNQTAALLDERGFGEYIGSLRDIDPRNLEEIKAAQYDPKRFFQGYLQAACKMALSKNCALRLNTGWKPIMIFPQTREVWIDVNEQQLRSFCLVPVHSISELGFGTADGDIMTITPINIRTLEERHLDPSKLQRMDALIWKVALWTSAGRVPEEIDLIHPVYLRHWPNFTRLLIFPNALRIAALLSEHPRSLMDVAETLRIRQRYAFAFFSAARALGLADQAHRQSENLIAPPPVEPRKNTGLLRKVLQRLLGR